MSIIIKIPFYRQDWDTIQFREMGFVDEEECEYWKNSSCGVLSLKMAIEGLGGPVVEVSDYIAKGLELGAYSHERGWDHAGLAKLANGFGYQARNLEGVSLGFIQEKIDDVQMVIVSIPTAFRKIRRLIDRIKFWQKPGGHLCLVVGYELENENLVGFKVNHTSINPDWNWENRLIKFESFMDVFTGRVILISKYK